MTLQQTEKKLLTKKIESSKDFKIEHTGSNIHKYTRAFQTMEKCLNEELRYAITNICEAAESSIDSRILLQTHILRFIL